MNGSSTSAGGGDRKVSASHNVSIYSLITGSSAIVAFTRVVVLTMGSLRAAVFMHRRALSGIIFAPLSVFGLVRRGVLMNRMLGDIAKIDEVLANAIVGLVTMLVQVLSVFGVIALIVPQVLLLVPVLAWPYWIAAQYYRWGMRDLRRIQSSSRAPLLTHFEESLRGLPTICAYGARPLVCRQFEHALRENGKAYFVAWAANQWVTCIMETIGVLLIGGSAIALTLLGAKSGHAYNGTGYSDDYESMFFQHGGVSPGKVGMTLSLTFGFLEP